MIDSQTCKNTILGSFQKWKIGNVIRAILRDDTDVTVAVGNNIFPLIAPEGTVGDFIIYAREKYSKTWSKLGVVEDDCQVALTVVSDNYDKAIDLASKVDNALVGTHVIDNHKIQIDLADSTESFEDNKYIEVMLFSIK